MIKKANRADALKVARLAIEMWDEHTIEDLTNEFEHIIDDAEAVVYIKYDQNTPIGFAQCQLRHDYVEGTDSSPVGYLEGVFVKEEFRKQGYARELLSVCENWAREHNCTEFASDCELDNGTSILFHLNAGFEEVNRIVCFAKKL